MIAILIILSLILVAQTIKIIVKTNIIDKNLIDYYTEYVVAIIILLTLIFEKSISPIPIDSDIPSKCKFTLNRGRKKD